MTTPVVPPNDKSFLSQRIIQESMDQHARNIAIAFADWKQENTLCGLTNDQLYDEFLKSLTRKTTDTQDAPGE